MRDELVGRGAERRSLERLLQALGAGRGGALVLRGVAGAGKTALIDHAVRESGCCRGVRLSGVPGEMDLPYAALHLLCSSLAAEFARLRACHREAVEAAIGLRADHRHDRLMVGIATAELLSLAARDKPLLCVVDDAHWVDRESADVLAFVARRLADVPVAFLFAEREPTGFDGLPELPVPGLSDADARDLLEAVLVPPVDEAVAERLVAEACGNPRALVESVRGTTPAELSGGYGSVACGEPSGSQETVGRLSPDARVLLIAAAAEPLGDLARLWQAASGLGVPVAASVELESAGLLSFGTRVTFRDPALRSVAYALASVEERRAVHDALAAASPEPDRRAWHRAQAAPGPDDTLADDLAHAAAAARQRGGLPAEAAFLARATALAVDPLRRAEYALAAAIAHHEAGSLEIAARLIATAELGPVDETRRATLDLLRTRISFDTHRDGPEPPPLRPDPLFDAVVLRRAEGYAAAVEPLKLAIKTLDSEDSGTSALAACLVAPDLWDDDAWHAVTCAEVRRATSVGALTALPYALTHRALADIHSGDLAAARRRIAAAAAVTDTTGVPPFTHAAVVLAAWQGRPDSALPDIEEARRDAEDRAEWTAVVAAKYAEAVLYNGLGRYKDAVAAAGVAAEHDELALSGWSLVELIEAAVRSGARDTALSAMEWLAERTCLTGADWALGVEARSRALLRDGQAAEALYLEAIDRLSRTTIATELARTRLLYGEWLRRQGRRVDARVPLRAAHESFVSMGVEAFAERAHRELLATGERARRRVARSRDELTPQEIRIAQLARDGRSNPEIGMRLSISPRTVEYHLHKVFTKLTIASRTELHLVLDQTEGNR